MDVSHFKKNVKHLRVLCSRQAPVTVQNQMGKSYKQDRLKTLLGTFGGKPQPRRLLVEGPRVSPTHSLYATVHVKSENALSSAPMYIHLWLYFVSIEAAFISDMRWGETWVKL